MDFKYPVAFLAGPYDKEKFYEMAAGMEDLKEGGARCMKCYELRLSEAAVQAAAGGFDYFTTTLSISPLKNAQKLNEIGIRVGKEHNVKYLVFGILRRRTAINGRGTLGAIRAVPAGLLRMRIFHEA